MEQITKLIDFLESYPSWIKYLVVGLIISIVLLLILFKPSKMVKSQWKLRVYDFQNFGDLTTAQNVGERISGRILDDLIRRQLNAQAVAGDPPVAVFAHRGAGPTTNLMQTYRELAPFVEIAGYVEEGRNLKDFRLYLRVTRIDSNLEINNLLDKEYTLSKDESDWGAVAHSVGEEILGALSGMPPVR
jgi:hypothetical protein